MEKKICGAWTEVSVNDDGYEPQNAYCQRHPVIHGRCPYHFYRYLLYTSGIMRLKYLIKMWWLVHGVKYWK